MVRAGLAPAPDAMYASLGDGVVELLDLSVRDPSPRIDAVELEEALLAELAMPGPVVFLASHTGNWELGAAALARHRRLHIVAKRISSRGFDAFMAQLRTRLGIHVIPPAGALAAARTALREGGAVALPIDQVPDREAHALRVPFLGAEALVDRAPATLAVRAGARMLVVAAEREEGVHRIRLLGALAPEPEETARRTIDRTTREATRLLDAFVRARPGGWLWLHRRWRAPRPCPSATTRLVPSP